MKKGQKKLRPSLLIRLKLHLALRRARKSPPAIGEDAMLHPALLAEIHAKQAPEKAPKKR